jgi:hypothetical protein
MEKKLPIYYASINEDLNGLELKQQGIQNIALVDSPAMLTEWLMFSEQKPYEFKMALQEEQRIVTAPVIIADLPIYRKIETSPNSGVFEEFYVVYKKETNMQILQKYMLDGNQKKVKLTHDTSDLSKGVFVFEIFMSDESRGITAPKGFESLSDGTIYCSMKINNDAIWNEVKAGKVKGISLEGFFDLEQEIDLTEQQIESIINDLIRK